MAPYAILAVTVTKVRLTFGHLPMEIYVEASLLFCNRFVYES